MVESLGLLSQFEGNVFPGSTHSKAMVAVDRNQGKLNILYFSISYYSTVVVCSAEEPYLSDCCLLDYSPKKATVSLVASLIVEVKSMISSHRDIIDVFRGY